MTLQDLCLNVIVEKFDRYFEAFDTTEDANLKRKFEFLQRVYSFEIVTRFSEEGKMEEKYVDLLINKYLKVLDDDWFIKCPWKTARAKVAEVGPNIKKLYLHECSSDRPWQEMLCHLPDLEVLYFHRNCTNEVLNNIAKFCPNITEIDVRFSYNVDEDGLKYLCEKRNGKFSCSRLKKLFLKSCTITEAIAKMLIRNLPSLEVFDYQDLPLMLYTMHKQDLPKLDKIQPYNLNKLDFFPTSGLPYFKDILKICLSVCPHVTTLSCPIREPQYLDLLSELSHLETLHLECEQKDKLDVNNLLKLKGSRLASLKLGNCSLSVLTLARNCTSLKLLSVNKVSFEAHDGSIPLFHNLDTFTVISTEFSNTNNLKSVCSILSSSPKLEIVTFERCNLSSSEMKTEILKCCEHCFVRKLDFSNSTVDKQFVIDILLTCHALNSFILDGCELDSEDEDEISRCAELLPNNPEVFFSDPLSGSDYDDFFDDYDNDFDDDDYDDEYDDYLHVYEDVDDEDYDEIYGIFF